MNNNKHNIWNRAGSIPTNSSKFDRGYQLSGFLLGLTLIISTNSQALYWQNNYGADLEIGTDDNFFLTSSNNAIDTNFSSLSLYLGADGSTEISSVQLLARINSHNYSDKTIDDSATYNFSLAMSNQGERLDSGLDISYESESTFESELLDSGVRVDGRRETLGISPDLSYRLNERNSLSMNLSFEDVSYDTVSLIDYRNNSLLLSWGYGLDETSEFTTNVNYTRYEPDNAAVSTDTSSFFLGYEMRPTETTTYHFRFGYSNVDGPAGTQSSRAYSVDINNQRDELNSFTLNVSQTYQPSGLGNVRLEKRLGLGWVHAFSEKVQGLLSADYIQTDDRDYYQIQPGLSYRLSEHLGLAGNYRYRREERTTANAESNSLLLSISYNP